MIFPGAAVAESGVDALRERWREWVDPAQRWLWRTWSALLALAAIVDSWGILQAQGPAWTDARVQGVVAALFLLVCWLRPGARCGLVGSAVLMAAVALQWLGTAAMPPGLPEATVAAALLALAMATEGRTLHPALLLARHVSGAGLLVVALLWIAHRLAEEGAVARETSALGWAIAVAASGAGLRGVWSIARFPRDRRTTLVAAALGAGLALVTTLAWVIGAVAWLKLPTVPVVMHSGTAIAVLGLGLGLWCSALGLRWLGTLCAAPAIALPWLNFLADLAGRTTHPHWLPVAANLPGQDPTVLAPNIAISLCLAVLGLMAVLHVHIRQWREAIAWGSGFLLVVVTALALFGYALDVEDATSWGSYVPMAPMTALGLGVTGIGIAFAGADARHLTAFRITWLPVLVAGSTLLVTSIVWLTVQQEQQQNTAMMSTKILAGVEERIDAEREEMHRALARMARRGGTLADGDQRTSLFEHDANLYLQDMQALSALATSSGQTVRMLEAREELPGQDVVALLKGAEVQAAAIRVVRGGNDEQVPVALRDGRPGLVWVLPSTPPASAQPEVVMALVDVSSLVRSAMVGVVPNASVVVRARGGGPELYSQGEQEGPPALQGGYPVGQPLIDIEVWPSRSVVRARLPLALLLIGLLSGGLLAVTLRYSALARQRAEYAEEVQGWLAQEIEARIEQQVSLVGALEQVRQNEQRFHGLAMAVADALWDWDLITDGLWWSDGVTALFGHGVQDLGAGIDGWMRYIHPDDLQGVIDSVEEVKQGDGVTWISEYRFARKDGRWAHVLDRGHVIRDENGAAVRMVGGMTDLTESREIHAAMAREREFLAAMLESLTEGVVACDAEGNLSHYTQVMQQLHSKEQLPMPKEAWAEAYGLCSPETGDVLSAERVPLARALAGETVRDVEMLIRPANGPARLVQCNGQAVLSADGEKLGAVVTMRDITARRQLELEREQLSRERGILLDSMGEGLLGVDEGGRCAFFNQAAARLLARPSDALIGRDLHALLHGIDCVHEQAGFAGPCPLKSQRATSDGPRRTDTVILKADGSRLPVTLSVSSVPGQAGLGTVITFTDISQRVREENVDAGKREVLAMIAERLPVEEALARLAAIFEASFPHAMAAIAVLDPDNYRLRLVAPGSLPEDYVAANATIEIGAHHGSCGTAAYRGQRVIVADIAHDPLWENDRERALANGLKAAWCTPVRSSSGEVLAALGVYYRQTGEPGKAEVALIDDLAALAGVALEQSAAYRRLATSEQRFRSLFQEHPDAVYAFNTQGRFVAVNRGFESMLGVEGRDVIDRHFEALVAPEDRERTKRYFERALAGEAVTYESQGVRKDGGVFQVRVTNFPMVSDGGVVGVFGVAHDISQLRAHERNLASALAHAEDMGSQLRRLSQAGVRINSVAGGNALCQTLADLMRFTLNAAHTSIEVLDPRAPAGARKAQSPPLGEQGGDQVSGMDVIGDGAVFELVATDGGALGQLTVHLPEGRSLSESDRLVAEQFVQMASAAIERMMLIERLTERDRFFEMSKEIFVVFDPATGRFNQVNPTFCEVTGYDQKTLCAEPFEQFLHPADRTAARERVSRWDEMQSVRSFSNRYLRQDGGIAWIEWTTVPGADGMIYGVGRDVTERTRAQVALQQSLADLATRNRELQDFAFVASHDLQEPLRKIRSFTDRLIRRHADALDEQGRDYLDRSGKAAARMQLLIENLLAYSRVTSQGKPFQTVDLGRVVTGVLDDLEATIEGAGATVEVGPMPTLPGDASQLGQVLQNLIANALKFRAPDRAARVQVSADAEPDTDGAPGWHIRVQDNGIGFEDKYGERIFAPFQRLHGRHEFEGTGIGLAIVRKIAERHRGRTWATGVPGEGACFHVWLPERLGEERVDWSAP